MNRLCQSCQSYFSIKRRHTYAYVNGRKVYGCGPCAAWGKFDKWLDSAWANTGKDTVK